MDEGSHTQTLTMPTVWETLRTESTKSKLSSIEENEWGKWYTPGTKHLPYANQRPVTGLTHAGCHWPRPQVKCGFKSRLRKQRPYFFLDGRSCTNSGVNG